MKGGVILEYCSRVDGGRTTPQTKNDTFIGKNPILTLQGHNTTNKYLETKNWNFKLHNCKNKSLFENQACGS